MNIQDGYNQLADAYLLKYQFQKRKQEKLETKKENFFIQRPQFFKEIEKLLAENQSSAVGSDNAVNLSDSHATTVKAPDNMLALIKVFLENGYGLDAVRRFNESFSLRAANRLITVQELNDFIEKEKNILAQKGITTPSLYLPAHYSESDLYHAPDSEKDKVIRSSGRKSVNSHLKCNSCLEKISAGVL